MRLHHLAMATVLACSMLVGCKSTREANPDISAARQLRQSYTAVDPNAKVGLVIAVLPEKGLAAVGDLPVADFFRGDVLVFVDPAQKIIAAGTVVEKTADALHVKYDLTTPKGRAPQVGDLAVMSGR